MLAFLSIKLIVILVIAVGAGFGGTAEVARRRAARKRLRSAPTVVAEHEYVTVTGTVRANGPTLTAPLSGAACVYWRATAKSYLNGDRSTQLGEQTVFDVASFIVETQTGDVYIAGDSIELTAPPEAVVPRRIDREGAFLASFGWGGASPRNIDCGEIAIAVGARISVHGVASVDVVAGAGLETGYRDVGQRTTLVGTQQHPLTIEPLH